VTWEAPDSKGYEAVQKIAVLSAVYEITAYHLKKATMIIAFPYAKVYQ
jgi:hypothetical protein